MRLVIQRVKSASVTVNQKPNDHKKTVASIDNGLPVIDKPASGGICKGTPAPGPSGASELRLPLAAGRCQSIFANDHKKTVASIGNGLLVLVGLGQGDDAPENRKKIEATLAKMLQLRIFPDVDNHMNLSLTDHGGEILLVSQFTLYADCKKGRRPSFHLACPPDTAESLYAQICDRVEELLPGKTHSGIFAADMDVALTNWGPVTIILDSADF